LAKLLGSLARPWFELGVGEKKLADKKDFDEENLVLQSLY
jgi:hypothetical protein